MKQSRFFLTAFLALSLVSSSIPAHALRQAGMESDREREKLAQALRAGAGNFPNGQLSRTAASPGTAPLAAAGLEGWTRLNPRDLAVPNSEARQRLEGAEEVRITLSPLPLAIVRDAESSDTITGQSAEIVGQAAETGITLYDDQGNFLHSELLMALASVEIRSLGMTAAGLEGQELGIDVSGRGAFGGDRWRKELLPGGKPIELLPEQTTSSQSPFFSGASRDASETQITMPATNTDFNPTESFPKISPANAPANRILAKSARVLDNTFRRPSVNIGFPTTPSVAYPLESLNAAAGLEGAENGGESRVRSEQLEQEIVLGGHSAGALGPTNRPSVQTQEAYLSESGVLGVGPSGLDSLTPARPGSEFLSPGNQTKSLPSAPLLSILTQPQSQPEDHRVEDRSHDEHAGLEWPLPNEGSGVKGGKSAGLEQEVLVNGRGVPGAWPANHLQLQPSPEAPQTTPPDRGTRNQSPSSSSPSSVEEQRYSNQPHIQPHPNSENLHPKILAQNTAQNKPPKYGITGIDGNLEQRVSLLGSQNSFSHVPIDKSTIPFSSQQAAAGLEAEQARFEAAPAAFPAVEINPNLQDDPIFQRRDPIAVYVDHDETIVPWPRAEMTEFFANAMGIPLADRAKFYNFYRFEASGLSWEAVLDAARGHGWTPPADLQEAAYMAGHNALLQKLTRERIQRGPTESPADYEGRNFLPGAKNLLPLLKPRGGTLKVVTGGDAALYEQIDRELEIRGFYDEIHGGGRKREYLQEELDRRGLQLHQMIMLGDHPPDIIAARSVVQAGEKGIIAVAFAATPENRQAFLNLSKDLQPHVIINGNFHARDEILHVLRLRPAAGLEDIPRLASDLQEFFRRSLTAPQVQVSDTEITILLDLTMPAGELLLPYLPPETIAIVRRKENLPAATRSAPGKNLPSSEQIIFLEDYGGSFSDAVRETVQNVMGPLHQYRLLTRRSAKEVAEIGDLTWLTIEVGADLDKILEILLVDDQSRREFKDLFTRSQTNWEALAEYL